MQIGERLKEAREEKGLSLEDIQQKTKIQNRYLQAIEEDNLDDLPGKFYARAFIKEYALAVGLDPTELLEGFDEEKIQPQTEDNTPYARMSRSNEPKEAKGASFLSFLPTVIVVILIVVIIFVAITLYQKYSSGDDESSNNPNENEVYRDANEEKPDNENNENEEEAENEENENEENENEEEEEPEFSGDEEGEGTPPESKMTYMYDSDKAELTFEVEEETYFLLQNGKDGEAKVETTLNPDDEPEPIDISDEDQIYINVGYAPGVKMFINDVELTYPVDAEEESHQKILVDLEKAD